MGAFGKIRHTTIKGEKGTTWYVELWKEGHTDASIDMTLAGEGFTITWNGEGSTRSRNFLGSECVLNLYVQNDTDEDLLYDILSKGFRKYFIRIYKNSTAATDVWWYGWIAPAFDTIENAPYPYQSSITATDSYGYYSQRPIDRFENDGSTSYTEVMDRNHSIADVCTDFIKNMDLQSDSVTDWYPTPDGVNFMSINMSWNLASDAGQLPAPAQKYYISKAAFAKNENFPREYKESDVFKETLKIFNLTGMLAEGRYYFFQPNSYLDNPSTSVTFFNYDDQSGTTNIYGTQAHNITIDQTNNILLGGSSFTYEPPLKSVNVKYDSIPSYFYVPEGFEITDGSYFTAGQMRDKDYEFKFDITHSEKINLKSSGSGWKTSSIPYTYYQTDATLFSDTTYIRIKVTDGTTTKYLKPSFESRWTGFLWSTTDEPFIVHRGLVTNSSPSSHARNYWFQNWDELKCVGDTLSSNKTDGPCFMDRSVVKSNTSTSNLYVEFKTNIIFEDYIPSPGFDNGVISIKVSPGIDLSQRGRDILYTGASASYYTKDLDGGDRLHSEQKIIANEISLNLDATTSTESTEAVYTATQSTNTAIESIDLGSVTIGQSNDPKTSIRDSNKNSIINNFQVASDTSTSAQLNQLLVDQFLEMQVSPLQILQGSIQSADISPLKIIKYKLNSSDADYGYYMFQGGTFKANSEIMDGEWFKLKKD